MNVECSYESVLFQVNKQFAMNPNANVFRSVYDPITVSLPSSALASQFQQSNDSLAPAVEGGSMSQGEGDFAGEHVANGTLYNSYWEASFTRLFHDLKVPFYQFWAVPAENRLFFINILPIR